MNLTTAARTAKMSYAALQKKCKEHMDEVIEIPGMGKMNVSMRDGKPCVTFVDRESRDVYTRDYQNKKASEKYSQVRDIGAIPECMNPERRERCSKDLALFLKTYLPESFCLPWSEDHLKIIKKTEMAIFYGGLFALAMPRGSGKTTLIEGSALFAALYGHRKYIVPIGASASSAESMLESIKSELDSNELLLEDFPEVCFPFKELEGVSLRAKGQTYNGGVRTHVEFKANKIIFPTIEDSKASGVIINPKGLTGHLRGLKHKKVDGEVVRPDLVLLDDPQDDEAANSPSQCDKREALINGAVLGLAGHKKKIAGIMPCTIIAKDDLAARMLDQNRNPDWQGEVCKMIYKWPDEQKTLWKEYAEIRKISILEGERGASATEFYREHREEMDKGAVVGWEHRKYESELSALQHTENLLLERGESAFYAEFQNDPIAKLISLYELTPDIVASRTNNYLHYQVPPEARFLTVGIDINVGERGINYVVLASCNDLTSYVVDYDRHPKSGPVWKRDDNSGQSEAQAIHKALLEILDIIVNVKKYIYKGEEKLIDGILIDCGYMMTTVFNACRSANRLLNAPILPSRGFGFKNYKPTPKKVIGTPGDNFHKTEYQGKGHVIVHNGDTWKMQVQKAFLMKPGAPGSLSLYGKDAKQHKHYAENICCEVLSEFVRGDLNDHYTWAYRPGYVNDLLDAQIMATVAAGVCGATMTGGEASWRSKPARPRRKASVTYY